MSSLSFVRHSQNISSLKVVSPEAFVSPTRRWHTTPVYTCNHLCNGARRFAIKYPCTFTRLAPNLQLKYTNQSGGYCSKAAGGRPFNRGKDDMSGRHRYVHMTHTELNARDFSSNKEGLLSRRLSLGLSILLSHFIVLQSGIPPNHKEWVDFLLTCASWPLHGYPMSIKVRLRYRYVWPVRRRVQSSSTEAGIR